MKKFTVIILFIVCLLSVACAKETPPYAETFTTADYDMTTVAAIKLQSGRTGYIVWLTETEDITKIVESAALLTGSNPISSRGYYGSSYIVSFYTEQQPSELDEPMLSFAIFDNLPTETYLISGAFEEVNGHTYKAMYPIDSAYADLFESICADYVR